MNLFDFAMKMELDGKAYYEKLAAETPLTGLKNIFLNLARDEQKHHDAVSRMKSGADRTMAETTVLEEAKNLFEGLMVQQSVASGLRKDLHGYEHAMKIEADSIRFYEDMAAKESNPETARLLLKIAAEERKHYDIMENLYTFVQAPENYLVWGEFSNLKEF